MSNGRNLNDSHLVADVAARHCIGHPGPRIGGVACGACWERAIRDDERFVIESGLDRDLTPSPDLVDEVAVQRACAGERLPLSDAELAEAVRILRAAGWSKNAIVAQLGAGERAVVRKAAGVPRGPLQVRRYRSGVAA
jgi:hypothetical protein